VYNKALALQKERYGQGEKKSGYAALCKLLTEWRNSADNVWLKDTPAQPLQQKLKDLERAYQNFFQKRAEFPRFKRKGIGDSFRYPEPKHLKLDERNSRIFLPKLGWVKYRNSRRIEGSLRNVTVSLSSGRWFVSVQTEREAQNPIPIATTAVGIDMGITSFAAMSDGTYLKPLNSFKKHEKRLAHYQRAMSRKQKFSNNWKKAKAKVQKPHARIASVRKDYLHKATTAISKSHAMVCIEDLQVKQMSKSARDKRKLNKAILDQGWFEFRRQLEYKLQWNGGRLITVPPQYTSQTCHKCGHVSKENRVSQAKFICVACGHTANADHNAALNILAAGQAVSACGAEKFSVLKQEPAEASHIGDAVGIPRL
jgi:putative transposase